MDGRRLAAALLDELRARRAAAGNPSVTLATVVVGGDRAAVANVTAKHRAATAIGMGWRHVALPATVAPADLAAAVAGLVDDPGVHGVFVQLPLPAALDTGAVLDLVPPAQDVDGLGAASLARLVRGHPGPIPATAEAVLRLLGAAGVATAGRRAVVVGHGPYLAVPLALLLARAGAGAVVLADPDDPGLATTCRAADLVVTTADRPGLIGADHVAPGAAVIDAGVTRTAAGVVGDVDMAAVRPVAGWLVPMPGGVGPMTVACLLGHTVDAALGGAGR